MKHWDESGLDWRNCGCVILLCAAEGVHLIIYSLASSTCLEALDRLPHETSLNVKQTKSQWPTSSTTNYANSRESYSQT